MAEYASVGMRHPRVDRTYLVRTDLIRTDLIRTVLMLGAFGVTLGGLHTILEGAGWWALSIALCVIVFGVGLLVRTVLPARGVLARILSPLAGAVAVAITIVVRFAADVSLLGFLPTGATVDRFQSLVHDAGYSITWQSVPARADEPISFVFAVGVGVLVVLAEAFAFSLRRPALVGLPLAAIFLVPGLTPEGATDGWFFAGSALAYLALLLAPRSARYVPAVVVGAIAVVGGLILPGILPSTDITATSSGLGPSVSTGINAMLHLGDDLRKTEKRVALTYSTVSGRPEYLRLVEVSDFLGKDWGPSQPNLDPDHRPVDFPRPPGLEVGIPFQREVTYVHVANLHSPWLPIPYPASSVTGLTGAWQYVPASFTVASNSTLARGENYTVSSMKLEPTPEQLLAAGSSTPKGLSGYLSLPPNTPAVIATTAQKVTAGESSNYAKALAIQEYLRSPPFQYSESAPVADGYDGTGVEYVGAFLEQHRGYCIHFASAMAVMARELGIPSRIIVGFQPGHLQSGADEGRRLFEVTTGNLHTWPELYFSGIGWVRFEPTPSRGSVPDYANPTTVGVPSVQAPGADTDNQSAGKNNGASPRIDEGPTVVRWLTQGDPSGWLAIGGTLAALILLVLLPAILRLGRRFRRFRALKSGTGTATSAWRELIESAEDVGIVVGSTLTPRGVVTRLQRVRGMAGVGVDALERICTSVEQETYGRPDAARVARTAPNLVLADDLATVLARLRASVDSNTRLRAALLPPSLVSRAREVVARFA